MTEDTPRHEPAEGSPEQSRGIAALSALLDDDTAVAWEIVRMMHSTELETLAQACRKIEAMCENAALRLVEATLRGRPRSARR